MKSRILLAALGLVLLFLIFSNMDPFFSGSRNISNVLRDIAPILLIGVGQSIVLVTGNIDLSIGSVVGMSGMIASTLMTHDVNPLLAVVIALAACLATGFLNGELVAALKIPSYIATLGTMMICRGLAQIANGNYDTAFIGSAPAVRTFRELFFYNQTFLLYDIVWISFLLWGLLFFLLAKTRTGRHFYAIGNNLEASRLSGVNVVRTTDKAFVISALMAGVAGLILIAEDGVGRMANGNIYELYAVAVAVIGGISTLGGKGLLAGTAIGALIWGILQNGLIRAEAPIGLRNIAIGIIALVLVAFDVSGRLRRSRS